MENFNDINNLDPNDEGLQAIMGGRFHDMTRDPAPAKKAEPAPAKAAEATEEKPARKSHTVPAADWEPVEHDPTQLERLAACAKSSLLFGGLCFLFFCWQQSGLMDPAAAVPSMLTCALLGGVKIGKHATK